MGEPTVVDAAEATLQLLLACRRAATPAERRFVLLNRSRDAWPYQLALLAAGGRVLAHSGVGQVEMLGPYAQWLQRVLAVVSTRAPGSFEPGDLPPALAAAWPEYWPPHGLWLPAPAAPAPAAGDESPGWLLLRELPWTEREAQALARWWQLWLQDDRLAERAAQARPAFSVAGWLRALWRTPPGRRWAVVLVSLLAVLCWPVALTVRAPGELVPRHPVVVRAQVDGTVRMLKVEPNQPVRAGQLLAEMDDAGWQSRLQVARQALATAEAEWRQTSQQALMDPRAKAQLAAAQGRYEERRAEVAYLGEQVQRSVLVAPQDGVALIQDPGSWPGRSVGAGEAVMKLAAPQDQEVEAWLPVADAVDLPAGTPMALHLAGRTGAPVVATLRLFAFEAEQRTDWGLGYRLRGTLQGPSTERLGARGTVRLEGPRVPLVYWLLRRPLATLREATGW